MIMIRSVCKVSLILLAISLFLSPLLPAVAQADDEMMITLDFQNVEMVDMINTISELTGKNFIYDETVRGKVSILSPEPVSLDEAYRLFLTVLRVKGFTVVPAGKALKVVSLASAREETLPLGVSTGGDQYITRILELKNIDATVAVETILRPLMPKTSYVVAHQATNAVVATDTADNIRRLSQLLAQLDRSWENDVVELVSLQYAEAVELADTIMTILEGSGTGNAPTSRAAARQAQAAGKRVSGQVLAYERTNTLMLQGNKGFIEHARQLISQLDVAADAGRAGVHVFYLEHAQAEPLAETINSIITGSARTATDARRPEGQQQTEETLKDVTVTADVPTNSLIINATAQEYESVKRLIDQLDIKRKQVFVEALIMELSMDAIQELGASFQGALETGSDSVIVGGLGGAGRPATSGSLVTEDGEVVSVLQQAVTGIMLGGLFNPITTQINGETVTIPAVSALINLSQTDSDVNVLSAPRLLTSDNEEAEIIVGENVPIITSRSESSGGNLVSAVERQDAALILRFTPQITAGDLVRMKIHQEISGVKDMNDNIGPTLTKTLLRNSIVARDGETVVLGGLFKNEVNSTVRKVPLLGDIPVLGWLFKSKSDTEKKTSLLIFITPRVVRNGDDLARVTEGSREELELFYSENGADNFFKDQRQQGAGGGPLSTEPGESK